MDNISAAQEIVRSQLIENEFGGVSPSFFEQLPHRSVGRGSFDISPHPSDSKHLFTVRSASNTPDCSPTLGPAASPAHLDVFGNQIEKKALTAAAVDLDADDFDLNSSPTHVIRQQIQTEYDSSWLCDLPARSTGVANALCDERNASLEGHGNWDVEGHGNWDVPDGTPRASPAQLRFASSPVHLDNFGNPVEKKPMLSAPNSASGSSIRSSVPNSASASLFGAWSAEPERDIDGVESQLIPLVPNLLLGPSAIPDVYQNQSIGVAIVEASIRANAMSDWWQESAQEDAQESIQIQVPLSSLTKHGSSKCKTKLVHSFPNGEAHVSGRAILMVQKDDRVYALDARCHHQGGALWEGDIEELPNGRTCITCPRHGRKIAVNNGEVLGHKGRLIDPNDDLSSLKLKNPTMPPQRTHRVTIDEARTMATIHVMQDSDELQEARMRCGIRVMSQDKENCIEHAENEIPDSDIHANVNCSSTNEMFAKTKHQLRIPVENEYQARRQQSTRAAKPFRMGRPVGSRTPRGNTTRTQPELYAPVSAQTRALLGPITEQ